MSNSSLGPWTVDLSGTSPVIRAQSVGVGYFSSIGVASQRDPNPVFGGGVTMPEAIANARMFAASLELLEALEACLEYGSMTGAAWVSDKALAAITKARGES